MVKSLIVALFHLFFFNFKFKSVATSITYPVSGVSTVTVVSGCSLLAGQAPRMVFYASWIDALKHLHENVRFQFKFSLSLIPPNERK